MIIKYPQELLIFYKESNHDDRRCAWANYDDQGNFTSITDFYGEILALQKGNRIYINGNAWVLKDHLDKVHRGKR